jgi:hypothetical protein
MPGTSCADTLFTKWIRNTDMRKNWNPGDEIDSIYGATMNFFDNYPSALRWLIDAGFIEEIKESLFKPGTVRLSFETEDDLRDIYHRLNWIHQSFYEAYGESNMVDIPEKKPYESDSNFQVVSDLCEKMGLML